MIKDSKEHLKSANETYFKHFKTAVLIGISMIFGGIQAILHAIIPGILNKSASERIKKLYKFVSKRS